MRPQDDDPDRMSGATRDIPAESFNPNPPPHDEMVKAENELWRLRDDLEAFHENQDAWLRRWETAGYTVPNQFFGQIQQQLQQWQQQQQQIQAQQDAEPDQGAHDGGQDDEPDGASAVVGRLVRIIHRTPGEGDTVESFLQ